MIIVTPAVGWPEPRPHQLITGDRAIKLLDSVSSSALQKAGVKLATVSGTTYQKLVDELIPEVFEGLDDNGKLRDDVLPSHLTSAAIADVDLRGGDGRIEEAYIPTRLSATAINDLLAGLNSTKTEDDPDGTPVILATETGSNENDNWTVTGTSTLSETNATDLHADIFDATSADILSLEVDTEVFVEQGVAPGNPAAGKYKVYFDGNQRMVWRGNAGIVRRMANRREVTSWPIAGESYLGDQAIHTTTGEHRIYLGTTKGWRLASPHTVSSLTERDALTSKYPGYQVFCDFGVGQNMIWKSDSKWHGTESYLVTGTPISASSVNDANFRRFATTVVTDPGYEYRLEGELRFRVGQNNQKFIVDVWVSTVNSGTSTNLLTFAKWFEEPAGRAALQPNLAPICTTVQTGAKDVLVDWKVRGNNAAAFTDNYQATITWRVFPA